MWHNLKKTVSEGVAQATYVIELPEEEEQEEQEQEQELEQQELDLEIVEVVEAEFQIRTLAHIK